MVNEIALCDERRQDLYFGRTRIPNALLVRTITDERTERVNGLDKFIDGIITNQLPIEQRQLETARQEICRLKYPELDLSFLSDISSTIEYKGQSVRLPRFGVYHIDEQDFSINMSNTYYFNQEGLRVLIPILPNTFTGFAGAVIGGAGLVRVGHPEIGVLVGGLLGYLAGSWVFKVLDSKLDDNYQTSFLRGNRRLPEIFVDKLIRCMELSDYVIPVKRNGFLVHDKRKVPKKVREKFCEIGDTTFSSQVGFAVPQKTKTRIKEAEKYFERLNLYFLAEVKPEDWNATRPRLIEEDPLLVGLSRDRCYLVDSFNPTALEKKVVGKEDYRTTYRQSKYFSQN